MAQQTTDLTDDSYTVDIGTIELNSLSETASPDHLDSSASRLITGSFISRAFPISKSSPEIRVLDLQESDHFDDPLVGTFRIVSLDQGSSPSFTALSYVWGTTQPAPAITIDLGVGLLPITRNCHDALRQIRQRYGNTTIWVDSICIDQTCDSERCHQVSLMGDVYSRAKKVYVWLGQETPGIRRALECIEFAASFMYLPLNPDAVGGVYQRLKFQLKVLPPIATFTILRNKWRWTTLQHSYRSADFEELLGLAWFSRIWTFQEVVLATNAVILCGTAALDWSVFVKAFRCLRYLLQEKPSWNHDDRVSFTPRPAGATGRIDGADGEFEIKVSRQFVNGNYATGFLALQRVVFLWMYVDRQCLRSGNLPAKQSAIGSSILCHQIPYVNMWKRHVRIFGAACTHAVALALLCGGLIAFVKYYHAGDPDGKHELRSKIFYTSMLSSFGSIFFLAFLFVASFHPEGDSSDLSIRRPKQQVRDQLVSAVTETLGSRQGREPKDMSYALYGVLRGFGVDLAVLDYNKPQTQIYHELCLDMLRFRSSAINFLIYVNKVQQGQVSLNGRIEASPTWVPDWSRLEAKQFFGVESSRVPEFYCATEQVPTLAARFSEDQKAIFVSGHWKGTIDFCMGSLQVISDQVPCCLSENDAVHTCIQVFLGWVDALEKLVFSKYLVIRLTDECRGTCISNQYVACSCRQEDEDAHPAVAVYALSRRTDWSDGPGNSLEKFRLIHDIFAKKLQGGESLPRKMTLQAAQDILDSLRSHGLMEYFSEIINGQAENNSRWFITSDGYLGCGTASMMPGDRLALVAGVAAPMVLRPLGPDTPEWFDSRYMAVCSAYVLGWMHGEVFKKDIMRTIHIV